MRLELTQSAVEDLRAISDYTLEIWGGDQQDVYLGGIYKKFEEIVERPAQWRFRHDLFPQCQVVKYGRHVILFICNGEMLTVVRILHGAMDLKRHLPEEY